MEDNAVAKGRLGKAPEMATLVIRALGSPVVETDGVPLQVDTRKAIALLVYLAVTGRPQSRDRLTGMLWPEYDQERARAALRRTLSALKKALDGRWVSSDRLAVSLQTEGLQLDVEDLRDGLRQVRDHDHGSSSCGKCIGRLREVVDLYGSGFLAGFSLRDAEPFEEWLSVEAEAVERELREALDRLLHMLVASGDLEQAVGVAQRKLSIDPLDEPGHRELMELYAWRGMRTAALQQYRDCVAILDRELGVSPLPETTALYNAIGEGSVAALEQGGLQSPPVRAPVALVDHPLRGRQREWDALRNIYADIGPGGALVLIEGEAGIGKTRVAREFLQAARDEGSVTVEARSHEGEGTLPYALVAQVLSRAVDGTDPTILPRAGRIEAARLVPSLAPDSALGSIDDPGGLTRFFEGVRAVLANVLSGGRPGVLLLDDLHWCDRASLELLGYIARRLDETPVLVIAAFRSEQVDQEHTIRRLFGPARGSLLLSRLTEKDVVALAQDSGVPHPEEVGARLMQETEGIPFFLVEYLNVLANASGSSEWRMPGTIKELLRQRASLVGETARQVMGTASVIDRAFDFETVWESSGRTELETVDALEELVRYGLVAVAGSAPQATYEFSHDKLREFVYESLSPARRRVLHRRVADAFIGAGRRGQPPVHAALIARHLELGGRQRDAATYHELAAQKAREVFANRDALDHYKAALSLGHPEPAALHEGAGDMSVLLGHYTQAIDSYETAAALAEAARLPTLEQKLGDVHQRRGDWDLSQSHFVVALETLRDGEEKATAARLLAGMSLNAYRKGDLDEASTLGRRALSSAVGSEDPRAMALAHNQLGILEMAKGREGQATGHLEESLRLATELDDVAGRAAALNNLAQAARARGELEPALQLTSQALNLSIQQGDSHRAAALHSNLADLLHEKGDTEAAMAHLKEATTVLAKIGDEPTGPLPEVWKLVQW
jgi:DNA-binding SARP family transcriptional activator/predicted ATPase